MTEYSPPLREIRFTLDLLADLPGIAALSGFEEATPELTDSILAEAARIASDVIAPLNHAGDLDGNRVPSLFVDPGW